MSKRKILTLAAAGAALALAATSAQAQPQLVQPGAPGQPNRILTPEQSAELARSKINPADVKFMQDMIHHHAQAVEMVGLLNTRTQRADMKLLGQRIQISQDDEMRMMKTWLTRRGQPLMGEMDHSMMNMPGMTSMPGHDMSSMAPSDKPMMPGMLSPKQMVELAAAKGTNFDRLFLTGMIRHHEGALDMVHELMKQPGAGEDSDLFDFTAGVLADQSAEIIRMQGLLATLPKAAAE